LICKSTIDPAGTPRRFEEINLERELGDELREQLGQLEAPSGPDYEDFLLGAYKTIIEVLPIAVLSKLQLLKEHPQPPSAVLIKGNPIDDPLGDTPANGRSPSWSEAKVAKAVLLGYTQLVGIPYSYRVEKGGDLVHSVSPVRGQEKALTNVGSTEELGFHTELAFFEPPPHHLLLLCARSDHDRAARTPIADARAALKLMSADDVAELRRAQFRIRCPYIFDESLGPGHRYSEPRPVLVGPSDSPEVHVALYGDLTQALSAPGKRALQAFDESVRSVAKYVRLEAGDVLLLDNFAALHARTSFQPRFDGKDRWLLRCHVADSMWPHRHRQVDSMHVLA
jgi:L-asparagine oxygenase